MSIHFRASATGRAADGRSGKLETTPVLSKVTCTRCKQRLDLNSPFPNTSTISSLQLWLLELEAAWNERVFDDATFHAARVELAEQLLYAQEKVRTRLIEDLKTLEDDVYATKAMLTTSRREVLELEALMS